MVTTFSDDERLDILLDGYLLSSRKYPLFITGDYRKRLDLFRKYGGEEGIVFLGWLSDEEYFKYLAGARCVVSNTIREFTVQRVVWEAALFKKFLIVPGSATLHDLLGSWALFYDVFDPLDIARVFETFFAMDEKEVLKTASLLSGRLMGLSRSTINIVRIIMEE